MNNHIFATIAIIIVLISAFFIGAVYSAQETFVSLRSSGTIIGSADDFSVSTNGTIGIWFSQVNDYPNNDSVLFESLAEFRSDFITLKGMGFSYVVLQDFGWCDGYDRGNFGGSAIAQVIPILDQTGMKFVFGAFPDNSVPVLTWNSATQADFAARFQEMGNWLRANNYQNTLIGISVDNPWDAFNGNTVGNFSTLNSFVRGNLGSGFSNLPMYYDAQYKMWNYMGADSNVYVGTYDYGNPNIFSAWQDLIHYNNETYFSSGGMFPILDLTAIGSTFWDAAEIQAQINYCVNNGNMTSTIQYFDWVGISGHGLKNRPDQWDGIRQVNYGYNRQSVPQFSFPNTLTISVAGSYYSASYSDGTIVFGGPGNACGVNGLSFSDVSQAAINAVGTVNYNSGNFVSDAQVNITANNRVIHMSSGTFIQQRANITDYTSIFCLVSRVSNVSIEGGWIDGNRWNQTPDHNTDTDLARFGIFLSYLNSNCTVKGLTATNFTNCGIDVAFANDILIDGVHTSGNADGGIWIDIDTFNFTVQNCVSDTDASGMPAVFFDDMGNHVGLFLNDTVINAGHCPSPNRFSPGVAFALYWGSSTTKPYGITWRDCTSINSGGAAALWINLGTNCTVENCSFTLSDVDGINLNGCSNIIVRNNIIANNGWYGVRETQGAHDNSIYGNNLQSNGIGDLSLSGANTVAHHNNPNIPYP